MVREACKVQLDGVHGAQDVEYYIDKHQTKDDS